MSDTSATQPLNGYSGAQAARGGAASFGDRRRAAVSNDIDPWDLLRAIWARKERLLVLFVLFLGIGAFWVMTMDPVYVAEAQLSVKPQAGEVSRFDAQERPPQADPMSVESEVQILTSGALVPQLIRQLNLHRTAEFNPTLRRQGGLAQIMQLLGVSSKREQATLAVITENVLSQLSVRQRGTSRLISISFTSEDPRRAAAMANAYAEIYIASQISASNELNEDATEWLKEQIAELRDEVVLSEAAVEQFRSRNGLFQTNNSTLPREELSQLNSQLVQAQAERSAIVARLTLAKELVDNEGAIDTTAEVLQSPLIQNLRQQEVQLKAQIAEMAATLLPSHPRMRTAQANLQDLRHQIGREVAKLIRSLENEAHIANERVRSLEKRVNELKRNMSRLGQQEVELRALEREATANRTLLEQFLARYEAATARSTVDTAVSNATIVARATVPANPSAPNRKAGLVLAIIGAAFGSLAVVFLIEALAPGFRTPEQVERQTGMPFLGTLPDMAGARTSTGIAANVMREPYGHIAEALRRLQGNLLLARIAGRPARTLLVTSAVEGEGKSGVAGGLARLMAQSGYRVILIDADLRRPRVNRTLGLHPTWGLAELLEGRAEFERLVTRDHSSPLHILQAGGQVTNPTSLLGSSRMSWLIYALMQNYDYVVIDGPSVHSASEAPVLSQLTDVTVLCTKWGSTNRRTVMRALKALAAASTRRVGVFLTGVDRRQYARLSDDAANG
ncbi:MAG: polysaccharide biosynthesis tyrosine autokinase [Parvibaculaceae bacterium]